MDIETLRGLVAKATPGPWAFEIDRSHFDSAAVVSSDGFVGANYYRRDADAHLVVFLLNSIPEIIAMAERVRVLEEVLTSLLALGPNHDQWCEIGPIYDCTCNLHPARQAAKRALSKEPRT